MLISLFSKPDPILLQLSVNTLWSCDYQCDSALVFVNIKCIQAVVAMVPHVYLEIGDPAQKPHKQFFLVEKPGLDVAVMAGIEENFNGGKTNG
jgi:hypothetical protein